jgi:putative holliday junction resolvase
MAWIIVDYMKILGLDLGDRWVGTSLSDALGMTCKPYQTVELDQLRKFLASTIPQERITTVVVGYPKTFSGGASEQTTKIEQMKNELEAAFKEVGGTTITWILWDERLSSKRASELHRSSRTPEEKKKSHSVAAAFILQSYLDHLAFLRA